MHILRPVLAVVVGYLVMVIFVTALTVGLALALGTEGVYESGTFHIKPAVSIAAIPIGLVNGMLGGFVCSLIARTRTPVIVLMCLVILLGVGEAVVRMQKPDPGPRAASLSFAEVTFHANPPTWFAFAHPLVGAVGILLGGRRAWSKDGEGKK
jgi:hypothetical protein